MSETLTSTLKGASDALNDEIKVFQGLADADGHKQESLSQLSSSLSSMTIAEGKLKAAIALQGLEIIQLNQDISTILTPFVQKRQSVIYAALNKGQLNTDPGPTPKQAKSESKTIEALNTALLALSTQLAVAEAQMDHSGSNNTPQMDPDFTPPKDANKKPPPLESWGDLAEASKKWMADLGIPQAKK